MKINSLLFVPIFVVAFLIDLRSAWAEPTQNQETPLISIDCVDEKQEHVTLALYKELTKNNKFVLNIKFSPGHSHLWGHTFESIPQWMGQIFFNDAKELDDFLAGKSETQSLDFFMPESATKPLSTIYFNPKTPFIFVSHSFRYAGGTRGFILFEAHQDIGRLGVAGVNLIEDAAAKLKSCAWSGLKSNDPKHSAHLTPHVADLQDTILNGRWDGRSQLIN